jgi:NAD(P) transhydrogenase subunit alpha
MRIFVPRERTPGEHRVAVTPETVERLAKKKLDIHVESGAGVRSNFTDAAYAEAGATVVTDDREGAWTAAEAVLKVAPPVADPDLPGGHEVTALPQGALFVGFTKPDLNLDTVRGFAERKHAVLSMELIPRTTRAQSMDALSSQGSLAGYKAALLVATHLDKYCPLLMTAAGTIQPARAVVMGAGVAGLQALATLRRLGAVVEVSDIREAVREEVESLGGKFIDLPMQESGEGEGGYAKEMTKDFLQKQQDIVADRLTHADCAITTALIPGRPAPKLITKAMVEGMRPGAVIVDMAVERGGNCELSVADEVVEHAGVRIYAPSNVPATVPGDASRLYARNVAKLLELVVTDEGELNLDLEDEIVAGTLLAYEGEVRHARTRDALGLEPEADTSKEEE